MTVAGLILLALGMIVIWWAVHDGINGRLINVNHSENTQPNKPVSQNDGENSTKKQASLFQLDLNRADWPELTQLPRIGESLARRIVESRNQDGPYQTHEDLRRVQGIGPKTLENLKPYLLPIETETDKPVSSKENPPQ